LGFGGQAIRGWAVQIVARMSGAIQSSLSLEYWITRPSAQIAHKAGDDDERANVCDIC
jgi:hypothetical protein